MRKGEKEKEGKVAADSRDLEDPLDSGVYERGGSLLGGETISEGDGGLEKVEKRVGRSQQRVSSSRAILFGSAGLTSSIIRSVMLVAPLRMVPSPRAGKMYMSEERPTERGVRPSSTLPSTAVSPLGHVRRNRPQSTQYQV